MPRRQILNARQRAELFDLPTDQETLLRHYTLADDDIEHIQSRRRAHNRFGFALQLSVFRYPGRLLQQGDVIPSEIIEFLAAQLGLNPNDLTDYAHRAETRREHLADLREIYGYKMFTGRGARDLTRWLAVEAETAQSNADLAQRFVDRCRQSMMIVPGVTTVERLCANALVAAERRIETRIVDRLDDDTKRKLDGLLSELVDDRITRFVWLRQFEVGGNSADACRLLDRLDLLQGLNLKPAILDYIPPHRVSRLRRQGERYFADGLRDISSDRRLAILAVCAIEWAAAIADAIVETHDRIVGKTWREAKKICEVQVDAQKVTIEQTLRSFTELGSALLAARADGSDLDAAIAEQPGWVGLENLIAQSSKLTGALAADPLSHVKQGYRRFRRYAPRMLRALEIKAAPVSAPLLRAAKIVSGEAVSDVRPTGFTDHVFAVTSLLSYRFIPRIRDLPSKRLHVFDPAAAPQNLRDMIGGKIREYLIRQNWPDILRAVATMASGSIPPSQLLKKLASYPRQHELALALREVGRVERTLFIIDWLLDADMQRRAQIGLNKGEAHHALKNALRIGRQGEIRDRTAEGQHDRMAGLNLLAAVVIYWNTKQLGLAVAARLQEGKDCPNALLSHISPLGWAHILLTGEYRWRKQRP